MASMIDRMISAAKLNVDFYNEAERDTSLTQEALLVVVIVSLAGGIGSLLSGLIDGSVGFGGALLGAVVTIVLGVVNYYIWSYVTLFVGTKLFGGKADAGEMLRTLGYAHTPRLLSLLGFIPCAGPIISLVGAILSLVASVVAIREALDFDTGKAILTAIIGWVIILVITMIIGTVLGIGAIGVGGILSAFQGG
jgi:hypothetical protein